MKKLTVLLALALFAVSLAAVAGDKKAGEKTVSGTISKLDLSNRSMTVTDEKSACPVRKCEGLVRIKANRVSKLNALQFLSALFGHAKKRSVRTVGVKPETLARCDLCHARKIVNGAGVRGAGISDDEKGFVP